MRLLSQVTLYFRDGKSDKVYEVDLCELEPGQYLVNFRYGRRGAVLREGTKTEAAVSETKARSIFDKLVAAKEKKGYSAASAPDEARDESGAGGVDGDDEHIARNRALLRDLGQGERAKRPLDRIIWRVGELRLKEAEPMLIELLGKREGMGEGLRLYCLLWALGRCGGRAAIDTILPLHEQTSRIKSSLREQSVSDAEREMVGTWSEKGEFSASFGTVAGITFEALRSLSLSLLDTTLALRLSEQELAALPPKMIAAIGDNDSEELKRVLADALSEEHRGLSEAMVALYRHGGEVVRPALCQCLAAVPMSYGLFGAVRTIFKAAEYRGDAEIFGILAHRFETTRANNSSWYDRQEAFKKPTRLYLRKRVARTLRKLGLENSPGFVPMAVGVLLPYLEISRQNIAANFLLYGQNEKFSEPGDGASGWAQAQVHRASGEPKSRQEAYPNLWNDCPAALLHLIDGSACEEVHEMAVKVLRDNAKFCAGLDLEVLEMLVGARFDSSAMLGFELIQSRKMSVDLAKLLCHSRIVLARKHAHNWLRSQMPMVEDSELWASLILSSYSDNREFVRVSLAGRLLSEKLAELIVARVIADIGNSDETRDTTLFAEFLTVLLASCEKKATSIGEEVLRDLLAHSLLAVQEFGARLLLEHRTLSSKVPQDLLIALLDSDHASIRGIGTQLLGKLPQFELAQHPELFVHLALHELADLREGARDTILRVSKGSASFAAAIALALSEALLRKLPKGAPANAVSLLQSPVLVKALPKAEQSHTMRLLGLKSPHARQLGLLYLAQLEPEEFTLFDLVGLADHEMVEVRHNAWEKCRASIDRFRVTMPAIARLLDASWQDTRAFAIAFLSDNFDKEDLGPSALIAICDSVRPEIQQFGQKLIQEHFRHEDGQEYLAKLSEHPSTRLQNFVTNYLERYAVDDVQKLSELKHYFLSVLSRVNAGGVAKRRCLRFLEQEGLKSAAAAVVVGEILSRQSVTIAIGNKASIISAMVALRDCFPDLDLPIQIVSPPQRGEGGPRAI